MSPPLLRFLELVKKELGSDDARIELALRPPAEGTIAADVGRGFRVVATFDARTPEPAPLRARLETLVASFAGTLAALELPTAETRGAHGGGELSDALELLAHRARAETALVIDHASPEIWGSSEGRDRLAGVDDALLFAKVAASLEPVSLSIDEALALEDAELRKRLADSGLGAAEVAALSRGVGDVAELEMRGLSPQKVRAARAIAAARERADGAWPHVFVRAFATIYRLVLVFDGPFSELHAEGAVIRALPIIERLVTSLPPRDPVASGANVVVLRRLRRV
jgi:hypothetical protein